MRKSIFWTNFCAVFWILGFSVVFIFQSTLNLKGPGTSGNSYRYAKSFTKVYSMKEVQFISERNSASLNIHTIVLKITFITKHELQWEIWYVCIYLIEKKLVNKVWCLTLVLYFHRIFYLLWQKKLCLFFLSENIFATKLGFNENPGK